MMQRPRRTGGAGALAVVLLAMVALATAGIVFYYTRAQPPAAEPTLLISGDTSGWITPCGCTSNQSGGLPRRGTYLDELRRHGEVIYLDAGGAAGGTSDYYKVKFEAILAGEKAMGVAAHNLGKAEVAMGAAYLRDVAARMGVPFVSENARDPTGKRVIESRRIVEAGGKRIGIIGVVAPQYAGAGISVDDPRQAALEAITALKGQCDSLVVLAYLPEEELQQLASALPEVDAVIGGPTGQAIAPRAAGATMLAAATNKGKFLVEMKSAAGAAKGGWEGRIVEMGPKLADHPQQLANVKRYLQTLEERDFSASESGIVSAPPAGAPADYKIAGSAACLKCHAEDYNQWIGSKHAHGFGTLQEKGFHVDSQCQQCHTTGFGMNGGFVSAKRSGASQMSGVGCENCHGPSQAHVLNPKKRTTFAAIDQCVRCHDHENSPHFNYATYWEKIRHGKKAVAGVEVLR
jgi:hypothetical protein